MKLPFFRVPQPWEIEFEQYYPMYEQARALEKQGKIHEALEIYRLILKRYTPRGTVYYERPAIILEKLGEFDEAIRICNRAIKVINAGLFRADAESFERRRARLERKRLRVDS